MSAKQMFECANCGAKVLQYPSQVGAKVHCSRKCYNERQKTLEPHNKGKRTRATKPCVTCGSLMTGRPSELRRRKYCSQGCLKQAFANTPEKALGRYRVDGDCWLWAGTLRGGYGRVKLNGRLQEAHRASYEFHIGTIPEGLVLDHLCRNRSCINPHHLEPVTLAENIRRGEQGSPAAMKKHWDTRRRRSNGVDSRIGPRAG